MHGVVQVILADEGICASRVVEMCCEHIVDSGETRGVPGEVWPRRKYSLDGEKSTTI
jgi:hypothetical protein